MGMDRQAGRGGDPEMSELLTLLDEQTELATKTGLNADYVPGMVTVLSGDELLIRGARTVWEALSLVPGISLGMEFTGERQVLARGVGHGYVSGNIKFLLDNVSMNSTLLATANPVLNIPIEQVERIEVIRGPGSSVYGEFAYAGVVNVITRRGDRALVGLAGQGEQLGGGALWSWRDEEKDLSLSLNLMATRGEGPDVDVDEDGLYQLGVPELSNAPGPSNEATRYRGFFVDLGLGGLVRLRQVARRRLWRPFRRQSLSAAAGSKDRLLAPLPHARPRPRPGPLRHPARPCSLRGDAAQPAAGPDVRLPRPVARGITLVRGSRLPRDQVPRRGRHSAGGSTRATTC